MSLPGRLKECIGDEPVAAFAKRCRRGESLLRKYLSGSELSASNIAKIADAADVTVDWLTTGRGVKYRRNLADLAQARAESVFSGMMHGRRWEKIIVLVEGIEDEAKRTAVHEEIFLRAQEVAELDALRKAVAALPKKTA